MKKVLLYCCQGFRLLRNEGVSHTTDIPPRPTEVGDSCYWNSEWIVEERDECHLWPQDQLQWCGSYHVSVCPINFPFLSLPLRTRGLLSSGSQDMYGEVNIFGTRGKKEQSWSVLFRSPTENHPQRVQLPDTSSCRCLQDLPSAFKPRNRGLSFWAVHRQWLSMVLAQGLVISSYGETPLWAIFVLELTVKPVETFSEWEQVWRSSYLILLTSPSPFIRARPASGAKTFRFLLRLPLLFIFHGWLQ